MTSPQLEDVLMQKITSLQRCIFCARELRERAGADFSNSNVAVHQYRTLDPAIVATVIDSGLEDLLTFAETVRKSSSA